MDRELYLPKSWTSDPDRCAQAKIPDDRAFAYPGWYRYITLAMLAHAFLAAMAAAAGTERGDGGNGSDALAPLTVAEIRRLLAVGCDLSLTHLRHTGHALSWSRWRHRCQATARRCHPDGSPGQCGEPRRSACQKILRRLRQAAGRRHSPQAPSSPERRSRLSLRFDGSGRGPGSTGRAELGCAPHVPGTAGG